MKRWPLLVLFAGTAAAGGDPAIARLEHSLPAGWTLRASDHELVIRRDQSVVTKGVRHENQPLHPATAPAPANRPAVTLELRYRLDPAWTDKQLAAASATNQQVAADLRALRARYGLDAIHTSKGRPLPINDDERQRLVAYQREERTVSARTVLLPRCTLGTHSLFDSDDTYRQLQLDPADAMKEAFRILAEIDKVCPTRQ